MKVEAAVVTQKRQNGAFNADSVNINGKVLSHEVIQSGYKGTGVMSDTVFFSVSSSDIEGFADAAVAAFNERSDRFKEANCNPSDVITGYFKDSVYALGEMGHRSSELASSIMYATDNTVILAKTGNTQMYTYSVNGLAKVTPALFANDDGASQYGLCTFPTTAVGDIYLLVSPGVAQVLTDKDIEDICKAAEGSVKKIVNLITKVAAAKEGSGSLSTIAVKVTEVDEKKSSAFGFVSPKGSEDAGSDESSSSETEPAEEKIGTKPAGSSEEKTKKLKLAVLAAAIVLAVLGCAALGLKLFGGNILDGAFNKPGEATTASVTTTAAQVTTTKPAATTKVAKPTTTKAVTTTAPATTKAAASTAAPATAAPATAAPATSATRATYYYYEEEPDTDYEEEYDPTEPEEEGTTAAPEEPEGPTEIPVDTDPAEPDDNTDNSPGDTDEDFFD